MCIFQRFSHTQFWDWAMGTDKDFKEWLAAQQSQKAK